MYIYSWLMECFTTIFPKTPSLPSSPFLWASQKISSTCLSGTEPSSGFRKCAAKDVQSNISPQKKKFKAGDSLTWTEKHRPKVPNDIIGNQSLVSSSVFFHCLYIYEYKLKLCYCIQVKQIHDWLSNWHKEFLHSAKKPTGKKQSDSAAKKAVLISGSPGIGKSTSAKLVSQMLGFNVIEVIFHLWIFLSCRQMVR